MKKRTFVTITGRQLDLGSLDDRESKFLAAIQARYASRPEWSKFSVWWTKALRQAGLTRDSLVYRVCQDLEARLGIAQGKVAHPDYRDYLADFIEDRFGSRYRFCKETGFDPGQLSRVLAGRAELSLGRLQEMLAPLHASLVIQPDEDLAASTSPESAVRALSAVSR